MANMHMQLKKLGIRIEKTAERHGYHSEWAWKRSLENNSKWWNHISALEVLKTMGKEVRLGPLLGRDTYAMPETSCFYIIVRLTNDC